MLITIDLNGTLVLGTKNTDHYYSYHVWLVKIGINDAELIETDNTNLGMHVIEGKFTGW